MQDAELPLLVDTGAHDLIVFEDGLEDIVAKSSGEASRTWTNLGGTTKVKTGGLLPFVPGSYAMVRS